MRIVYLLSYFEVVGGQEFFLARQQAKQGHEVFVIAADVPYPIPGLRDRYLQDGLTDREYDHRPGRMQFAGLTIIRVHSFFHYQDFILVRGVKELLVELKPDVVFAHEVRNIVPMIGARYKKALGYVYFVDSHDFFHRVQNHAWWQRALRYVEYFWWRRWFVQYAFVRADALIAVAKDCRAFMIERHGIAPERIRDLPLGVESEYFTFDQQLRADTRRARGIEPDEFVLLFGGYMFRRKALENLVELMARLKNMKARLIFAGDGPADYIAELKALADKQGVADRIIFTGVVGRPQMRAWYCAADVGIWPGNNSLVVLEAMSCRLPVIMADMQLAHLVSHGNGLAVPYADTGAMEKSVRQLAADPKLRAEMGRLGEAAAIAHYSYAAIAKTVTAWMEEALAQKLKRT